MPADSWRLDFDHGEKVDFRERFSSAGVRLPGGWTDSGLKRPGKRFAERITGALTIGEGRMKIALLGLGIMGSRMGERLIRCGFDLTIWNRTQGKGEHLRRLSAREAESPGEAAAAVDVVITMLAGPSSVEEVALGEDGLLQGLRPGGLYIDMTTVSPETSILLAHACERRGVDFLDAPVTGGRPAAVSGRPSDHGRAPCWSARLPA